MAHYLGTVEIILHLLYSRKENWRLDSFLLGEILELVVVKEMRCLCQVSEKKAKNVVSWMGAALLSFSKLAEKIRGIVGGLQ